MLRIPLMTLLLAAPLAAQSGSLDQVSPFGGASFNVDASSLIWQQQVRVGLGGTLEGMRFEMYAPPAAPLYAEPLWLNQASYSNGACPSVAQVSMHNMTANGRVVIASAPQAGPSVVSNAAQCLGVPIGLLGPTLRVIAFADANGDFLMPVNLPPAACGALYVQGFDVTTCVGTNVVAL